MRKWIKLVLLLLVVAAASTSVVMSCYYPSTDEPDGVLLDRLDRNPPSNAASTLAPDNQYESTGPQPGGTDLESLYRLCGGQVEEAYVTGWARFDDRGSTEEELKSLIIRQVQPLEAAILSQQDCEWPPGSWAAGSLGEARGVNYSRALGADQRVEAWARSAAYGGEAYQNNERMTYLVVQAVGMSEIQMAAQLSRVIEEGFRQTGVEGRVSTGVVCWREGRMEPSEMMRLVQLVLEAVDAQEVERQEQPGLIDITAFSPLISKGFDIDGKRVNLQVAVRYRELDDRTYFHLGIPLIMTDY